MCCGSQYSTTKLHCTYLRMIKSTILVWPTSLHFQGWSSPKRLEHHLRVHLAFKFLSLHYNITLISRSQSTLFNYVCMCISYLFPWFGGSCHTLQIRAAKMPFQRLIHTKVTYPATISALGHCCGLQTCIESVIGPFSPWQHSPRWTKNGQVGACCATDTPGLVLPSRTEHDWS